MAFMTFVNQIPKDLYLPWYLFEAFIIALFISAVLFILIEISQKRHHRHN